MGRRAQLKIRIPSIVVLSFMHRLVWNGLPELVRCRLETSVPSEEMAERFLLPLVYIVAECLSTTGRAAHLLCCLPTGDWR